ncbi:TetR/AcrR family transcriptional regulator [Longispora sp. K20-0274]|uniref:TetR/AcrR family transcriptional regulator n=1 Tax=Longispora sp. K20-0274 TaxID=3088255 RepID=UPI00399B857B
MGSSEQTVPAAGKRADAARNIAAITDAALDLFSRGPNPSMVEVARAAGVGRVTLYAHFPSRETLLEAVLDRAVAQANEAIDACAIEDGPADAALSRLVRSAWQTLDRHRGLHTHAAAELGPQRLRAGHGPALDRIEQLLARGQADGVFRADLPRPWLVTTVYSLLHAAAEEVDRGELAATDAADLLHTTILSLLSPR